MLMMSTLAMMRISPLVFLRLAPDADPFARIHIARVRQFDI